MTNRACATTITRNDILFSAGAQHRGFDARKKTPVLRTGAK
jgi:hypothetical protein